MANDGGFERDFVNALNEYFDGLDVTAYAYRRKQSRFATQDIDVLIDSPDQQYYSAVEAKSKKIKGKSGKLYFSQHFSTQKDGTHQVEHIQEFIEKTGRNGYLAVAYRRGRGKSIEKYILEWSHVWDAFCDDDRVGIEKEFVEEHGVNISDSIEGVFGDG